MMQNSRVTAYTVFELLRENQLGGGGPPSRLGLKQDKLTYTHGKIVNIYIVYEISKNFNISSYPTLKNCLFTPVSLTKNNDIDKYKYSEYGIGFDRKGELLVSNGFGINCTIFWVDMNSSVHVDNKKKILFLG